jgi:uncharacterized protein (TIGR04222 family)
MELVAGALLLVAVALRFAHPRARARPEMTPAQAGMLAGGPGRALQATLVTMRLRGELGVGRPGILERAGGLAETGDPLERTVYRVLSYPQGPKAIRGHRRTIEAFDSVRRGLTRAGLLLPTAGWWLLRLLSVAAFGLSVAGFVAGDRVAAGVVAALAVLNVLLPRRTLAGSRLLRALDRALPGGDEPLDPATAGIAVALHGTEAIPQLESFVARGGLTDGGSSNVTAGTDPILKWPSVPLSADPNN